MGRAPVGVVLLGFVAVLAGIAHLFAVKSATATST